MRGGVAVMALWLIVAQASTATADDRDGAASAFARGRALFARHDYVGAIAAFERAYRLRPHHAVQCSIAHCYEQLNRFVESADHYRRCLEQGAARARNAKQVQRSLEQVTARISWVAVDGGPEGGTLFVDGVSRSATPCRVPLDPGQHMLEVRRPGFAPASMRLTTLTGEERSVSLIPTPVATRVEPGPRVSDPRPVPQDDRPEKPSRRRLSPAWFWTTVGITVALAGAAAVVGGLTYKAHSDYNDAPTRDGYDAFVQRRLVTNILAGLAVAAGATGTVLFFYTDLRGRRGPETVAGIGVGGTF